MKITVKAYFSLLKAVGGESPLEVEKPAATLRELLHDLSMRFGREFAESVYDSEKGEAAGHVLLMVNGRNYLSIPERLEAPLKDGDEVALFPPLAGG
jgi:MoaD family protein